VTPPRPTVRDAAVVLALAGAMAAEALWFPYDDAELTAWTWVLVVGTALPALVRRTHPVAALVASAGMLALTTDICPVVQTSPFPAMLAGFWLARTRGRGPALVAGALLVPYVLFLLSRDGVDKVFTLETPKNMAFIALPLVLGLAVRYREQTVQALVDRAESAERSREQEALRRVGEERLRIARDVHDVVSHSMVAINVQAGVGAHLMDSDPAAARQTLRDIRRISAETLTDLRGILGLLREDDGAVPVEPTLTLASLEDLASTLRATGLDLELDVDLGGAPLPASVDATAYRVVQEALTNVLRHAGTRATRVRIARAGAHLTLEVGNEGAARPDALAGAVDSAVGGAVDDPAYDAPVPDGSGRGLHGMRERVQAIGGDFHAGPRADGGWVVRARLPLAPGAGPVDSGAVREEEWA
jgi:signal transduction histidine kinase